MSEPEDRRWGLRTRAIRAGARPDPTTGARAVPSYQTTSFVFEDAADAADLFALQKYGNIYSRLGNPTVAALEERVASLEGGIGAVATGSGQAAETLLFCSLAGAGDHIVASSALYGGTYTLLDVTLRRLGIETTFVAPDDPSAFAGAVVPGRTKLLYTEYQLPTGGADPIAIATKDDTATPAAGGAWFLEPSANSVGHIDAAGDIERYPIPTANASPQGLADGTGPDGSGGAWFSETSTGQLGFISSSGQFSEFTLPGANPGAIAFASSIDVPPTDGYSQFEAI